jgi:hypothetical protein
MSEAPEYPTLERATTRRPALGGRRRSGRATLELVSEHDRASEHGSAITGSRGAETWPRGDFVADLRCECGRPNCRETFPAVAEPHRGKPGHVIVAPNHYLGLGAVLRAADQFFVVEVNERSARL